MRKGLLIVGIVLLVIGVLLLVVGLTASQTTAINSAECLSITPVTIGSDPVTISWSGGDSSTTVSLVDSCSSASPTTLASGTGSSGSFTATLTSGTTYGIVASSGTPNVTVAFHGLSFLGLSGIVLLIVGILLAALGAIGKARPKAAPMAAAPMADDDAPAPATGSDIYQASAPEPAPTTGSGSAPRICSYCGTSNEAWLTNCRSCKRPLASTGQ